MCQACRTPLLRQILLALVTLLMVPLQYASAATNVAGKGIKVANDEFHFVVLGDSQFHDAAGFNRIIDETVRLQPAFVVQVGDMIEGYLGSEQAFRDEWTRFRHQIGPLGTIPFVPVAGNHDVYDAGKLPSAMASALYADIWGKSYFSFTYRNARIIVLNSDEVEAPHAVAGRQFEWLRTTLQNNRAEHVFVFMHRPPHLFDNAAQLHALFVRHGVGHVIYGHHHHYHFREDDGVRYIMTNAAANSGTDLEATGAFDHLLYVSVRDGAVAVAPIDAGAVRPMDLVAPIDNYDNYALASRLLPASVAARADGERRWIAQLTLENTSARAIDVHVTCSSPDGRWQLSPTRIPVIHIGPAARQTLSLELTHTANRVPEGQPECRADVPYQTRRGEWLRITSRSTLVPATPE